MGRGHFLEQTGTSDDANIRVTEKGKWGKILGKTEREGDRQQVPKTFLFDMIGGGGRGRREEKEREHTGQM